jgi:hypothetical protein
LSTASIFIFLFGNKTDLGWGGKQSGTQVELTNHKITSSQQRKTILTISTNKPLEIYHHCIFIATMPKSSSPFAWETERLIFQRLEVDEHLEGCHEMISDERAMSWS